MTTGSLMKVESIAECSTWSILQYFWPALSDNWSWKPVLGLFESGRFTQVLLYVRIIMDCEAAISFCLTLVFNIVNSKISENAREVYYYIAIWEHTYRIWPNKLTVHITFFKILYSFLKQCRFRSIRSQLIRIHTVFHLEDESLLTPSLPYHEFCSL